MSVSLLIKEAEHLEQRLVPIAAEAIFKSTWIAGAQELGLTWIGLMETGVDVTSGNQSEVIQELRRLGEWMDLRGDKHERGRLDRLVAEIEALRFEAGATAFIG